MSETEVEPPRKRQRIRREIKFTSKYEDEKVEKTKPTIETEVSEETTIVGFNKRNQSILSVIHLEKPLTIQDEFPIPEINENEILVFNKAIGLNPIDWKGKKYGFGIYHFPWINGRESSGRVVKIGSKVKNFKIDDDVIISSTSYRDNRTSTFQQYTAIDSRLVWKLPKKFSYEDGATIGVGLVTAGILFYNSFNFELSKKPKTIDGTIVIWGGSTIVGIYITQLAKIYGLTVISIASTTHAEYLQKIGVDHLINRHLTEDEIVDKVKEVAPNGINYGIDCVSKQTSSIVLKLLALNSKKLNESLKPQFSGIVGVPKENTPETVTIREVVIKKFHEDISFGKKFIDVTSSFLESEKIKPARYKQYKGGLRIIDDALKDLEVKGANGEKYVVSIV
ncbi:unnamed protein product [Candida verbasci]|uniref:Enoyl reductase (ER) domain-containing protein n=1 Tax=Candida verbasci TaxID=1227364 RepID=A0A9W4XHA9_9ASCO|nr:unnamed protein product [Candida verbasci]